MSSPKSKRQELLSRIDLLLKEAYALPSTTESWERRLYIDWELFQLFRHLASMGGREIPSVEQHEQEENDERKPRRRDRPTPLPL